MLQVFSFESKEICFVGTVDEPAWIAADVINATGINPPDTIHPVNLEQSTYSLFDLYAIAVEYATKDIKIAETIMRLVRATYVALASSHPEGSFSIVVLGGATGERLYHSTMMYIAWAASFDNDELRGVQPWFKKNIHKLIPGAMIVNHRKAGIRIAPDFWVSVNGLLCPVEVKKDRFTRSSLIQLQNYLTVFECQQGYAVAKKLAVSLPSNIIFIQVEM